jgi:tetratricopeptide (TPR) repeat protein
MARIVLTAALIVSLSILVGCQADSGKSQIVPAQIRSAPIVEMSLANETDIVEQLATNRRAYHQSLELLVEHYLKAGDNMKLEWAKKELAALSSMPQYNYIIEAGPVGANLRPTTSIPEADYMYWEATQLEKKARRLVVVVDDDLLRLALNKYNELIKKHPSSDKIDDAAFKAAGIYEHFKDYTIALMYYQRTYQWDPQTIYPARYKAAYILDKHLHRRAEALKLYQEALERDAKFGEWREFAEQRIRELTKSDQD